MFRLVKVLNGNNQCDVIKLNFAQSTVIDMGCALICSSGNATSATSATSIPEFISLSSNKDASCKKIDAIVVTTDMVFKVEYTGSISPTIGMSVGLSTLKSKMDAVTYNSSGKGTIIGMEDDKKLVYVRFQK